MELLIIRPDDVGKGQVSVFSDQIINRMSKISQLDVIGIGSGVSLACQAVCRSSEFARIHVSEIFVDYLDIPILGKMGAFFLTLSGEKAVDWEAEKEKLEKGMKLTFGVDGQLLVISQKLPPEQIIPLCLKKLWRNDTVKILAYGTSIIRATNLALEITLGKISKEVVGVALMVLSTKIATIEGKETPITGLEIFLKKGNETKYSKHHKTVLDELRKTNP